MSSVNKISRTADLLFRNQPEHQLGKLITSMLAKANDDWADTAFSLDEPAERDLALRLLQYGHVVEATATSLEPHRLCTYLYELAESFSGFYQACPVLKAEDALRRSRLRLADLARRVITDGLDLLGIETPRVALMNVGGEEQKGTEVLKQAREQLRDCEHVDFIGYVEGRAVFDGAADVVITDGVTGNVVIKLSEGLSSGIFKMIHREVDAIDPSLAASFEPIVQKLYSAYDYHEYGGAPLLGVNGLCLICHGSSKARTITNAIRRATMYVNAHVNESINDRLCAVEVETG